MLDSKGFLLHIDFGFLLGRTVKFEKAPFKLTEEMIDLLGGDKSKHFNEFLDLLVQGFLAIRRHYEKVMLLIEMTLTRPNMGNKSFYSLLNLQRVSSSHASKRIQC